MLSSFEQTRISSVSSKVEYKIGKSLGVENVGQIRASSMVIYVMKLILIYEVKGLCKLYSEVT